MDLITKSGLYSNDHGEMILLTQGVIGYTLVAGKQFLFRYFADPAVLSQVSCLKVVISGQGLATKGILVPKADLLFEQSMPHGPSVGVIIRGFACPKSGVYVMQVTAKDSNLADISVTSTYQLSFLPTRDLRVMVVPIVGSAPARNFLYTDAWTTDVRNTMQRLNSMFPVRDCVRNSLVHTFKGGLRYMIGRQKEGWPEELGLTGEDYMAETIAYNTGIGKNTDPVDLTVIYRPCQPNFNESPGGNATYNGMTLQEFPVSSCVGGYYQDTDREMSAPCFAQEIGHLFGLEAMGSPHFDDPANPFHSKDGHIYDPYAFDFVLKKPFPSGVTGPVVVSHTAVDNRFLGDTLNNLAKGAWQGADSVMFNTFDWEVLRKGLMGIRTNPTGTDINPALTDTCGIRFITNIRKTHPLQPNQYTEIIGSRVDGKLYRWTDHGLVPVVPPGDPYAQIYTETARLAIKEFIQQDIKDLYIPRDNEAMDITGNYSYSLHEGNTDLVKLPGIKDEE